MSLVRLKRPAQQCQAHRLTHSIMPSMIPAHAHCSIQSRALGAHNSTDNATVKCFGLVYTKFCTGAGLGGSLLTQQFEPATATQPSDHLISGKY